MPAVSSGEPSSTSADAVALESAGFTGAAESSFFGGVSVGSVDSIGALDPSETGFAGGGGSFEQPVRVKLVTQTHSPQNDRNNFGMFGSSR